MAEPLVPPSVARTGRPPRDRRILLNGIFWILYTGVPCRDLPERFGDSSHSHEPGGAVVSALRTVLLGAERLMSFRGLRHLEIRQNHRARFDQRTRWKEIHKNIRKIGDQRSGW